MQKDIILVTNGIFKPKSFYGKLIKKNNDTIIIGLDGGNNFLSSINIVPDIIIGDFDSIDKEVLNKFKGAKSFFKESQHLTDLEYAIDIINKMNNISSVRLISPICDRFDHSLNNIISLGRFNRNIKVKIIDKSCEIFLLRNRLELNNIVGKTISVIPLGNVKGLNYKGLKWSVDNIDISIGWSGVSNIIVEENAEISLKSGLAVVILLN